MGRAALALLILGACFSPSPQAGAPCGANGACPSPLRCTANNTCQPDDVTMIDAAPSDDVVDARSCGADEAPCQAACGDDPCLRPAHVATDFGTFAGANLGMTAITATTTLDTSTGAISGVRGPNASATSYEVISGVGFIRRTQGNNPAIAIWVFGSLTISARVTATGSASVVLASANNATLGPAGVIDLGASALVPGAGGFAGGTFRTTGSGCGGGGAPAGTGTSGDTGTTEGGGGGGSFGTTGAAGGSGSGTPGAAGSLAMCNTILDTILVGGSGGGGGDTGGTVPGPFGGGGGGAIQLSSMGMLVVAGTITVGGGGGRTAEGNSRDGAGGGAGGAIFLEAPAITITASAGLYANGGGGGSASAGTGNACNGPLAENGKASLAIARGSQCASGFGGDGAASTTAATPGVSAISGGGGGGGLGRIVLRTRPGNTPAIQSTMLSPSMSSTAFKIVTTLE